MIVVNSSTRQFNIPGADLVFGVTADSGSVTKEFSCPRYVGNNLDLTGCFIRMNYRNAQGEIDSYLVKNVTVDGDNIVFGWELSPKVTMYKGNVSFVMCVVGPDTKMKWHTTLGRGQVLEGLEPDEALVEEGTADVVAALVAMVEAQTEAVADKGAEWVRNVQSEGTDQIVAVQTAGRESREAAVAEIEAKGVNTRESIPEDYTALSEAVDGLVRGKAPGIVCEAEGETVVVNDASDNFLQGLRIYGRSTQDGTPTPDAPVEIQSVVEPVVTVAGKNLLELTGTTNTVNGVTFIINEDGTVVANGTATENALFDISYRPSAIKNNIRYFLCGCPSGGGSDSYCIRVSDRRTRAFDDGGVGVTFEYGDVSNLTVSIRVAAGVTVSNLTFEPMICSEFDVRTQFEPYKPIQTLELTHTLPGIPVTSGGNYTDGDGQQWICDEVDLERGVYVQRVYDYEMTGRESWAVSGVQGSDGMIRYDGHAVAPPPINQVYAACCTHFPAVAPGGIGAWLLYNNATSMGLRVRWSFETLDELTDFLSEQHENGTPVAIKYPLAVPIETALSETEIAAYRALHSNYPNTTVLNDSGAHMVVRYAADTKLYIDNKIAALVGG